MYISLGVSLLFIWIANIIWIIFSILNCTPNFWQLDKDDISMEKILHNYMTRMPHEKMQFIANLGKMNPMLFITGLVFVFIGIFM